MIEEDVLQIMDPDSIPRYFILIFTLILLGGFFAASETACSNCNRLRLMSWAEDGKKSAARALKILEKFDKAIITLLIGNNVVHVVATASAAVLAIDFIGPAAGPVVSTVLMTLLVFIFSETIPKNIAKARSDSFICAVSGILSLLMILLTPLDFFFNGIGKLLKRLFRTSEADTAMTEDDFQSMIETIEDEGGLESDASELIQSAVEFTDRKVGDVLTPRVRITGLNLKDPDKINQEKILNGAYSRLPVYDGDLDHIVGVLNTKQYLQAKLTAPQHTADIRKVMAKPYYIHEDMGLYPLVDEMRRRKMHLAIVKDAWGGTQGMVTLEDLLEELIGEVWNKEEQPQ